MVCSSRLLYLALPLCLQVKVGMFARCNVIDILQPNVSSVLVSNSLAPVIQVEDYE